jgi:hypothetical protein
MRTREAGRVKDKRRAMERDHGLLDIRATIGRSPSRHAIPVLGRVAEKPT